MPFNVWYVRKRLIFLLLTDVEFNTHNIMEIISTFSKCQISLISGANVRLFPLISCFFSATNTSVCFFAIIPSDLASLIFEQNCSRFEVFISHSTNFLYLQNFALYAVLHISLKPCWHVPESVIVFNRLMLRYETLCIPQENIDPHWCSAYSIIKFVIDNTISGTHIPTTNNKSLQFERIFDVKLFNLGVIDIYWIFTHRSTWKCRPRSSLGCTRDYGIASDSKLLLTL